MRKTVCLLVFAVVMCVPAFGQGAFNDVPTDHWAYDAVNQLQKDGIVIGYPDGTYGGKRAMSRYEFATAIARMLPIVSPNLENYVTKQELADQLKGYVGKADFDPTKFATKADVDALRKLVDEFRDELAALGVDVDALKRDVAALCARVDALEAEMKRVRLEGDVNIFAIATAAEKGDVIDQAQRWTQEWAAGPRANTLARTIAVVRDFDLKIVGRVSDTVNAIATINYGNYLNYLGVVDDFIGEEDAGGGFTYLPRPTSKNDANSWYFNNADGTNTESGFTDFIDGFFPYYLYLDWALCKGNIQVGRFPMQWTPYTLKKIDVDPYTNILKTDDGNYPIDGIKLFYDFGGVDVTLYAAKHDQNSYLRWGLTGQPTGGLYLVEPGVFHGALPAPSTEWTYNSHGHAVGGLEWLITQSAGGRVVIGAPWRATLGLSFYQAWSKQAWLNAEDYDQTRVYGADLTIPLGARWNLVGSWTKNDTMACDWAPAGTPDIDDDNAAWDVKLDGSFGTLGLAAGYKEIGRNFAAAGYWDKIGRWFNPTNIRGPYVNLCWPVSRNFQLMGNAEWLDFIDDLDTSFGGAPELYDDTEIVKAQGGIKWGFSTNNSLDVDYEWVRYESASLSPDPAYEQYLTIGWAHQISQNAGLRVGYQFINWDGGPDDIFYGDDYRGGLGVVQFGATF